MSNKIYVGLMFGIILVITLGVYFDLGRVDEKYNDCMSITYKLLPDAQVMDRNNFCHLLATG